MALESMQLYSCVVCGHMMAGLEWGEHSGNLKDYKCPKCQHLLNEDELHSEDDK